MEFTNTIADWMPAYDRKLKEEEAEAAKEHRKAMMILELALTAGSAASFSPNTDNLSPELKRLVEKIKLEMAESEKNTLDPETLRQLISANIDSPSLRFMYNWILDRIEAKQAELENKGIKVDEADSFVQLEDQEHHASLFGSAVDALDLNLVGDLKSATGSAKELLKIIA